MSNMWKMRLFKDEKWQIVVPIGSPLKKEQNKSIWAQRYFETNPTKCISHEKFQENPFHNPKWPCGSYRDSLLIVNEMMKWNNYYKVLISRFICTVYGQKYSLVPLSRIPDISKFLLSGAWGRVPWTSMFYSEFYPGYLESSTWWKSR